MAPDGSVAMPTAPLDLDSLVGETADVEPNEPGTDIGHVHLRVSDVDRAIVFYRDVLGMGLRAQLGPEAGFLAAGDYHHHIGVNSWQSRGGGPPRPDRPGSSASRSRSRTASRPSCATPTGSRCA